VPGDPGSGFRVRLNLGVGFASLPASPASPPFTGVEKVVDVSGVPERGALVSLSLGVDGVSCRPSDGRVDDCRADQKAGL
jgi:hypothetical protein